jgi:AraC-like DNA-binding protein
MLTMTRFLDSRHRAEQAAKLVGTGATWQEIADRVGYRSRQAAQLAVKRYRDQSPAESVEQARAKHDAALQLLQRNGFTRYMHALQAGDDDTVLQYSKDIRGTVVERAKLAGAYAPVQSELTVTVEQSASAIVDRAESELLELVKSLPPPPLPALSVIDAEVIEETA